MKRFVIAAFLLLAAGNALADVLCEDFPDPLGGWKTRWLGVNAPNLCNYYVCWGGSSEDDRGNNPCGLWIADHDGDPNVADIAIDGGFGPTVSHFAIGIMAFVPGSVTFYAVGGGTLYSSALTVDGTFPPCPTHVYEADTPGGLGRFTISQTGGSQIEGNTSIDNVCATTGGGPVATVKSTWGSIKSRY